MARSLHVLALSTALILLVAPPCTADEPTGRQLYRTHCAECHGEKGQGVEDIYPDPLGSERSLVDLTKIIHDTMPEEEPAAIVDERAKRVAEFIFQTFYSADARARHRPPRIALARLTARQYEHAVADLIGTFTGQGRLGDDRGLKAQYFKVRHFRGDQKAFERIDAQVAFDFGNDSPKPGEIGAEEFSIQWRGGVIVDQTGDYEFCLITENGARLWVNDDVTPLIDAWVQSGDDTEHCATIRLLAGRVYPIRLDYFKFKNDTASVTLAWRPPDRVRQSIPERNLTPGWFPPTMVVETPFPADDRSAGYERGTSVSDSWDSATTFAAIEVAGKATERLAALSKVADDAPDRRERLKEFCYRFAERAFRRPLTDERKRLFVDAQFDATDDVELAVKRVALLVLKSPRFLYAIESDPLDDFAVASRLALALWDSLPDDRLLQAAAQGRLRTKEQVAQQAQRMLADPRTKAKLDDFLREWLAVDRAADISKDKTLYPDFDERTVSDLRTSLDLFLDEVVWSDDSDYRRLLLDEHLYLNRRLAAFYGVDAPDDDRFHKVSLDASRHAGVLTHPLMTSNFAYFKSSSPIHRGVFLIRGVLGRSLKPPPIAVAPLDEGDHADLTTRQRVALQTKAEACQSCHRMINPLGFTLENFDAVGRFREQEQQRPVDATGSYTTVGGEQVEFEGPRQLAEFLADSDEAHRAFVRQLFHYTVKQPVDAYGPEQLDQLQQTFADDKFNIQNLLVDIVATTALKTNPPENNAE